MKSIQEAAIENSLRKNEEKEIAHILSCEDFSKGVEFATKWHEINENTPTGTPILLKFVNKSYEVGYYIKQKYRGYGFYSHFEADIEFVLEGVTHWRPINF
jgi:hypothetical protein